jgi:hypothetical protein
MIKITGFSNRAVISFYELIISLMRRNSRLVKKNRLNLTGKDETKIEEEVSTIDNKFPQQIINETL